MSLESVLNEPASPEALRRITIATVVGLAGCAALYAAAYGTPVFPVDDAYISLHNAQVLRSGSDPSYVGIPALVGATSAAHVVVIAALMTVVRNGIWALWCAGWLAAMVYAIGVVRLARTFRASWPIVSTLVVFALIIGKTPHQLNNGLETGLAMAGVVWTLALAADEAARTKPPLAILVGTLPFLRPELAALSGLTFAYVAQAAHQRRADDPKWMQGVVRFAGLAAVGALPWAVLYWATTGAPFPNTVQAKRLFFAEGCAPAGFKLGVTRDLLAFFVETLGYASRGALLLLLTRLGWVGLAFGGTLVAAYFVNLPGALGHYEQRYLYVLVPFLLYALAASTKHSNRVVRVIAMGLLVVGVDESVWHFKSRWDEHLATIRFTRDELAGLANWANEHLPADAKLLIHDAGYVSWSTRFQLFDIVGLKTPSSIPIHRKNTWAACVESAPTGDLGLMAVRVNEARARAVSEISLLDRPTHLVVLHSWENIYGMIQGLRGLGWTLEPIRETPIGYEVFRVAPPR